jgi:hypothetical protein
MKRLNCSVLNLIGAVAHEVDHLIQVGPGHTFGSNPYQAIQPCVIRMFLGQFEEPMGVDLPKLQDLLRRFLRIRRIASLSIRILLFFPLLMED